MEKSFALRVGTFNIGSGAGEDAAHNMEAIARDILSAELDLVGMQEVDLGCWRTGYADMPKLLSQFTGYPYYYYSKCLNLCGRDGEQTGQYGDCILSKYPLKVEHTILEHGRREPRAFTHAQVDVNGRVVHFCNTHLEHGRKEEHQAMRLTQLNQIAELLRELPECILTGDFNCLPEVQYEALPFLHGVCRGKGDPVTFPKTETTIDNILYTPGIQVEVSGTLDNGSSDHCMVYAQLRLDR